MMGRVIKGKEMTRELIEMVLERVGDYNPKRDYFFVHTDKGVEVFEVQK